MWQVFWNKSAENELAADWLAASDRQTVTQAAKMIDDLLQKDPLNVGESREGDFRILFVSPLVVQYHVSDLDRKVEVLQCIAGR